MVGGGGEGLNVIYFNLEMSSDALIHVYALRTFEEGREALASSYKTHYFPFWLQSMEQQSLRSKEYG